MLKPNVSAGSDAAIPCLVEDGYAFGILAQIGMQIVHGFKIEQLTFMVLIHLSNAAVRVNRL